MEKGREGIGGRGTERKENGDRPSTIFGLKVALTFTTLSANSVQCKPCSLCPYTTIMYM